MNPPGITIIGDRLCFNWPEVGVRIDLDDIQADRYGGVRCQITIQATRPPQDGLIHQASFSLTGTRDRNDLIRKLEERLTGLDAAAMLEQLCYHALKRYREGEPVSDLREVEPEPGSRFLVDPLVEDRGATVIHADGGSGKTTIGLAIVVSVASGIDILGAPPNRTVPVLILDWETSVDAHAHLMRAICAGVGLEELPPVFYQRMTASLVDSAAALNEGSPRWHRPRDRRFLGCRT